MSDNAELSISELRRKRAQSSGENPAPTPGPTERPTESVVIETHPRPVPAPLTHVVPTAPAAPPRSPAPPAEEGGFNFDFIQLIETARSHWGKLAVATLLITALGCLAGYYRANYLVRLTLTLRDLSTRFVPTQDTEAYRPPQLASQTLVDFLVSPELLRYVSTHASPPISEKKLRARLTIEQQEKDSQTIMVTLAGKKQQDLVALANLYVTSAIEKSRESQMENPSLTYTNFKNSLLKSEQEQAVLNARLGVIRTNSGIVDPILENVAYEKQWTDLQLKIDEKQSELQQLEARENLLKDEPLKRSLIEAENRLKTLQRQGMRDEHPDVKRARAEISELSRQLKESASNDIPAEYSSVLAETALKKKTLEVDIKDLKDQATVQRAKIDRLYESAGEFNQLKAKLDLLDKFHKMVESRMFEAQQYRDNAEGYYKVPTVSTTEDVDVRTRYMSVISFGAKSAVGGFVFALALIVLVENINPRLKTAADVKRATRLPVLAALGDLNKMDAAARKAWAFRTWTILSGTLVQSPNRGTVCGIISCSHGEGRTTWIELLVDAARQRGFEVTKLDFRHVAEKAGGESTSSAESAEKPGAVPASAPVAPVADNLPATVPSPAVAQSKAASVIHVQLPGMVWDLERRIQFQEELDKWQSVTKAVILIDLPPACVPEAVLLAENLPQVLWLVDSGKSTARETRMHLETLRHARCKLVGAVLNHEPEPLIKL